MALNFMASWAGRRVQILLALFGGQVRCWKQAIHKATKKEQTANVTALRRPVTFAWVFLMVQVSGGACVRDNLVRDVYEGQEKLILFQRVCNCFIKSHFLAFLICCGECLLTHCRAGGGDCLIMLSTLLSGHHKTERRVKLL